MAAIYCATQKYAVNSGLGIGGLAGSTRPTAVIQVLGKRTLNGVP